MVLRACFDFTARGGFRAMDAFTPFCAEAWICALHRINQDLAVAFVWIDAVLLSGASILPNSGCRLRLDRCSSFVWCIDFANSGCRLRLDRCSSFVWCIDFANSGCRLRLDRCSSFVWCIDFANSGCRLRLDRCTGGSNLTFEFLAEIRTRAPSPSDVGFIRSSSKNARGSDRWRRTTRALTCAARRASATGSRHRACPAR